MSWPRRVQRTSEAHASRPPCRAGPPDRPHPGRAPTGKIRPGELEVARSRCSRSGPHDARAARCWLRLQLLVLSALSEDRGPVSPLPGSTARAGGGDRTDRRRDVDGTRSARADRSRLMTIPNLGLPARWYVEGTAVRGPPRRPRSPADDGTARSGGVSVVLQPRRDVRRTARRIDHAPRRRRHRRSDMGQGKVVYAVARSPAGRRPVPASPDRHPGAADAHQHRGARPAVACASRRSTSTRPPPRGSPPPGGPQPLP